MILIAGLGNPGRQYERTRHNVGFMLAERVSEAYGLKFRKFGSSLLGIGTVSGVEAAILKPQTFMNLSGEAVVEFLESHPVPVGSIIAAYDDCDLPFGKIRLRKNGGSGGHRGVESIIRRLKSKDFLRLRLGVGRPYEGDIVDYVLSPFSHDESEKLDGMLVKGLASLEAFIKDGIDSAMNKFNSN